MDILRLLEDLKKLIDETPNWGPVTWKLDRDEIMMQIAKIRASLPQELKEAVSTVREQDRIIATAREDATMTLENARKEHERIIEGAKAEAARILEQARLQQEQMVSESEILKLSKAQSEADRNAADRDALQIKRGAEKYAYDVLTQLESVVGKVAMTIERGKEAIQPEGTPIPERPARDKSRA